MQEMTNEEIFMNTVDRINRYLIIMGIFFLIYFLIITKVDRFLFLLSLSNMGFALLSHKLLTIARKLSIELRAARAALREYVLKVSE